MLEKNALDVEQIQYPLTLAVKRIVILYDRLINNGYMPTGVFNNNHSQRNLQEAKTILNTLLVEEGKHKYGYVYRRMEAQ